MITKPKKIRKKELEEDELVTGAFNAADWVEHHSKQIFTVVGILAVIIVAIVLYVNRQDALNEEAAMKIAKVLPLYDQGNYNEAANGREGTDIEGFTAIAEQYGGTPQGDLAYIYAANSLFYMGKIEEAKKYYSEYSGSDILFKGNAYAGEASCEAALGNYDKAASLYLKAAGVSEYNSNNPEYLMNAGVNFKRSGNQDKAKEMLEKIQKEYPRSTVKTEAVKMLAGL